MCAVLPTDRHTHTLRSLFGQSGERALPRDVPRLANQDTLLLETSTCCFRSVCFFQATCLFSCNRAAPDRHREEDTLSVVGQRTQSRVDQ